MMIPSSRWASTSFKTLAAMKLYMTSPRGSPGLVDRVSCCGADSFCREVLVRVGFGDQHLCIMVHVRLIECRFFATVCSRCRASLRARSQLLSRVVHHVQAHELFASGTLSQHRGHRRRPGLFERQTFSLLWHTANAISAHARKSPCPDVPFRNIAHVCCTFRNRS